MKKTLKLSLLIVLLFGLIIPSAIAQDKKLSMEDAIVGVWRQYYPEYLRNVEWHPDAENLSFIKEKSLLLESVKTGKQKTILDLEQLNEICAKSDKSKLNFFPDIEWVDENTIRFKDGQSWYSVNLKKKKLTKILTLPEESENEDINLDNKRLAFTRENNLYVQNEDKEIAITHISEQGLTAGQATARREFGIEKGTFWSPSAVRLAYYLNDESMVSGYPLVDISERVAALENIKYPMAGMKSEEVKLHVYDFQSGNSVEIKTDGDPEQYLTCISWTPDDKNVLIAVLNRSQNHMKMNMYDARTGDFVKTLFEEIDEKYVEPQHTLTFIPNDNEKFIWQSRRDGYNHLYLYDISGNLIKQLTVGEWEVTDIVGFTPNAENLIFQSTQNSPIERHIYKLNMNSGEINPLTKITGTHNATLSPDGKYILDNFTSVDVPNAYQIIDMNGTLVRNVFTAENPLAEVNLGKMNIGTIKASDNTTDLYYRMILPPDYDQTKRYPVIVYVYGGPHAQLVTNSWMGGASGWDYYMAQEGYIMFTLDNRGSAFRGMDFESIIHRNLGHYEMEDQMKGIEYLSELDYVDTDRIGVHGWSFGGFMTTNMMLHHSDVFKVGVAGGPVVDWKYYEVMYGERYMDTPEENPDGYLAANLSTEVENLKGKLLMIHGGIDPVVVQQHSLVFVQECIKKQIPIDYFVYPRAEHNVRGYDRIHLMNKVTDYFNDYLK
jgi:dipeptidyl-peptidase 4